MTATISSMTNHIFPVPGPQPADEAGPRSGLYLVNGSLCLYLQNHNGESWSFSFQDRGTGETIAKGRMDDLGFGIKEVIEDAAAVAGLSVRDYQKIDGRREDFSTPVIPA